MAGITRARRQFPISREPTLLEAAEAGDAPRILALLKAGAELLDDGIGSPLWVAAKGGHVNIVSVLLKAGAKPLDDVSESALCVAATNGYVGVVSVLLEAGVRLSGDGPALLAAAMNGHAEVVSVLLKTGIKLSNDGDGSALRAAAESGHAGIVSALLDAGVKPLEDGDGSALQAAAEQGQAEVVSALLKAGVKRLDDRGGSALRRAAKAGNIEAILGLVKAGVDINAVSPSGTALQEAAKSGDIDMVNLLIKQGANLNLPGPFPEPIEKPLENQEYTIRSSEKHGIETRNMLKPVYLSKKFGKRSRPGRRSLVETWPLCIAAREGHTTVVRVLLRYGAHADVGSPDGTAIRAAASKGHKDIVQILLDNGADINAYDSQGRNCLTWGISHPKVVQLLLKNGADTRFQASDGATPLHCAVRDSHVESVGLLLDHGADAEIEDYNNRKPLDIVLLDSNPSPISINLVKLFSEHGCDVGRRGINSWRTILGGSSTGIVKITETPASGDNNSEANICRKPGITVALAETSQKPCFIVPDDSELPGTRRLYSAAGAQIMFPELDKGTATHEFSGKDNVGSVIEWQWIQFNGFGISTGYGLSNLERLAIAIDKQALLSCYVCFEWFHALETEPKKASDSLVRTLGKEFQVELRKSEISWIMRKPCRSHGPKLDYGKHTATATTAPIFRSEDFRSTLDIGWIPDSGVDFFALFILDLHRKWRALLDKAELHLTSNRKILLQKRGKTNDFIDNLLSDAQQWSNFHALLQIHVRNAKDLVADFEERQFLCEEIRDKESQKKPEGSSTRVAVVAKLLEVIEGMEFEVEKEIKKLDEKTEKMIELEFNLVSIYEARTSKTMGMSMKRLSWITFVFLPLMFVASLFGMNVDIINNSGPHWWWVIALSVVLFTIVMLGWGALKIIRAEEEEDEDVTISRKLERLLGRNLRKGTRRFTDDLESEKEAMSEAYEFKPPPRRWTKLKEL